MGDEVYELDVDPTTQFPGGQFPDYHSLVEVHGDMADQVFQVDDLTVVEPAPEPLIGQRELPAHRLGPPLERNNFV